MAGMLHLPASWQHFNSILVFKHHMVTSPFTAGMILLQACLRVINTPPCDEEY